MAVACASQPATQQAAGSSACWRQQHESTHAAAAIKWQRPQQQQGFKPPPGAPTSLPLYCTSQRSSSASKSYSTKIGSSYPTPPAAHHDAWGAV